MKFLSRTYRAWSEDMAHHSLFPVREDHGLNRAIVNTAALAGAAYMGFRLIKLVNYWNKGEVSDIGKYGKSSNYG